MENLKLALQQKWFQLTLALVAGVTIGAIFYPSKNIEERMYEEVRQEYQLKIEESERLRTLETKELQEKLTAQEESHREYQEEVSHKVEKLTQENSTLKQSMKRKKLKIVRPDGTFFEQEVEESNTEATNTIITSVREEFSRKVKEIEDKWKKIHEERVVKLKAEFEKELEKARSETKTVEVIKEVEKTVEVNPKAFRPELGITTDQDVYLHATYPVWGPTFIGGGVSGTNNGFGEVRIGVGLEF